MNANIPQDERLTSLNVDYFQNRLDEALTMGDQNDRYDIAQADPTFNNGLEEFRALASDGLYSEQSTTLESIALQDTEPYAILAANHAALAEALDTTEDELSNIDDAEDERATRLLGAARRATELAPLVEKSADQLADARIRALQHPNRDALSGRIGNIVAELAPLDEMYEVAGQPWPVPLVIRRNNLSELIIDEIPLPPETHASPDEEIERKNFGERGYTVWATVTLTNYLVAHPDIKFTPEQLGAMLYTDETDFAGMNDEEKSRRMRGRIHSLLNSNCPAPKLIQVKGHLLQYGYRHFVDPVTKKPNRRKRRIYRTVPYQPGVDQPTTFDEEVFTEQEQGNMVVVPRPAEAPALVSSIPAELREELSTHDNDEECALINGVDPQEILQILWDNKLLPADADEHMAGTAIRMRSLQFQIPEGPHAENLRKLKAYNIRAGLANHATARSMLINALGIHKRIYHDTSEFNKVLIQAETAVTNFYENLED